MPMKSVCVKQLLHRIELMLIQTLIRLSFGDDTVKIAIRLIEIGIAFGCGFNIKDEESNTILHYVMIFADVNVFRAVMRSPIVPDINENHSENCPPLLTLLSYLRVHPEPEKIRKMIITLLEIPSCEASFYFEGHTFTKVARMEPAFFEKIIFTPFIWCLLKGEIDLAKGFMQHPHFDWEKEKRSLRQTNLVSSFDLQQIKNLAAIAVEKGQNDFAEVLFSTSPTWTKQ